MDVAVRKAAASRRLFNTPVIKMDYYLKEKQSCSHWLLHRIAAYAILIVGCRNTFSISTELCHELWQKCRRPTVFVCQYSTKCEKQAKTWLFLSVWGTPNKPHVDRLWLRETEHKQFLQSTLVTSITVKHMQSYLHVECNAKFVFRRCLLLHYSCQNWTHCIRRPFVTFGIQLLWHAGMGAHSWQWRAHQACD